MCMLTVVVAGGAAKREIGDVVDIAADGLGVRLVTLYGEEHAFEGAWIGEVDVRRSKVLVNEGTRR